ncbi:50S ribosomal protein L29 [Candidatus Microgenomates bacterium]|nr:50S ribosomal protein L29 [Candidatus Microgenomates bacterium]
MKLGDLRQQSDQQLHDMLAKQRQQISQLHVDQRTKDIKNVRELRKLKKTVARILTVLRERELAAETAQPQNQGTKVGATGGSDADG